MIAGLKGLKLPKDPRSSVTRTATDWAYAAGWMAVRALPEFAVRNAFDTGARYFARHGGPEQLRKNLARVLGVPPAAVPDPLMCASLESYGRYWREVFRLPTMNHRKLARQLDRVIGGLDHLDAALAAGLGAVLALPHSGNWDMAGMWLVQRHGTFTTVAERLKPESLYQRFIDYRESLGFEVLPLSGGERPPFEVLCERLRNNRVVCLMAERDLTRTGVEVDFFGEPPGCRWGRRSWRSRPVRHCCPHIAGSRAAAGVSRCIRRWIAPAVTSLPSHRRWPTASRRTLPPIPRIGTCCSPSGWPTYPNRGGRN